MKTKAEMTQEYSLILLEKMNIRSPNDLGWMERIAKDAAMLANIVQAEIEKNLDKSRPDVLNDWQPDWSQAPKGTEAWRMYGDGNCAWLIEINDDYRWWGNAPSFNYQGNWRDSLRKKP